MRRFFALALIAALLSVTSIPLLPEQPRCAHAAEALEDCDTCHDDPAIIDMSSHVAIPNDMDMTDMSMGDPGSVVSDVEVGYGHDQQLSDMAKECRIECACGCHRSLDGFPQVLAPHITPYIHMNENITVILAVNTVVLMLVSFVEPVSTPPPRLI